jgi:hypothetical protein
MAGAPAIETWDSLERIPHPKIRAFAEYWQSKRAQRRAPTRADIDPAELGPFLPHMYMLDVMPPGPRIKVRLLGTEAMQSGGVDLTGRFADEVLPPARYAELQQEIDDVLQNFVLRYQISDLAWQGRPHARYHRLMMPLSADQLTVTILFGVGYMDPTAGGAADLQPATAGGGNNSTGRTSDPQHRRAHRRRACRRYARPAAARRGTAPL